ncbi:hypothetical protein [Actinoplanes sp. NPDC026670]|uniref:hypothetical protein n=1 Tax=Actinoplanes sp. NPDC026670 TaxID=3154700 RepID=UPI0033C0AF2C
MRHSSLLRLARDVVLRATDHDRGWRAAYRERRLLRAVGRGEQIAIDAAWQCWFRDPGERWWTAVRHGMRPADPRSVLDTGLFTAEQAYGLSRVALDNPVDGWSPDGLAEALTMTGHPIAGIARERLRDWRWLLLAVLDVAPGAPSVISHLTREMVRDRDWDGLWRFARDLPPAVAAEALRDADPGWRPREHDGAELYALLRAADPQHLWERIEALDTPRVLAVDRPVVRGAFSADERLVAVTVPEGLRVFDVGTGEQVAAYELDEAEPGPVSFEGDVPIVAQRWPGEPVARSTIWRFGPRRRTGRAVNGWVYDMRPGTLDGSLHVASARRAPADPWPEMSLIRRHGPPAIRRPDGAGEHRQCVVLDTDPVDMRAVFAGDRISIVGLRPGNRTFWPIQSPYRTPRDLRGVCLAGPELVFTSELEGVIRWAVDDGRLKQTAVHSHRNGCGHLVWVPYRNAVAVTDSCHGLRYLDAETLKPQQRPGDLYGLAGIRALWSAPRGTGTHAVGLDGEIRLVLAPAAALAHQARQPLDRATLASVPRDPVAWDRAGTLVDVLAANDRYRASVGSAG